MSELIDKLFQSSDQNDMVDVARRLSDRRDAAEVPALLRALTDPLEARRWSAVYALGFSRRDGRVVRPLIQRLRDRNETAWVRGQAAECLGNLGRRKALGVLIDCSRDPSPEVRYWCTFALGQQWRRSWRRRHKPPSIVIRALEARLDDAAVPEGSEWSVGLEALGMLSATGARHRARTLLRETMLGIVRDPLQHREKWQWAIWYWDYCDFPPHSEAEALYESAVETIRAAGFDPERFRPAEPNS